jgi:hypothetical protein
LKHVVPESLFKVVLVLLVRRLHFNVKRRTLSGMRLEFLRQLSQAKAAKERAFT